MKKQLLRRMRYASAPVVVAGVIGVLPATAGATPGQRPATVVGKRSCAHPLTVGLETYPGNMVSLTAWVLADAGFLKRNCLIGQLDSFASGTAATAASISGAVNFLSLSPDTVYTPRAHGTDIEMVAGQNNQVYFQLGVPKGSPLAHESFTTVMKALQGKTIGVNGLGNTTYFFAQSNFRDVGLDPSSATYVALGPLSAQLAGLKYHRVDAVEFSGTGGATAVATDVATLVPGGNLLDLGQKGVGGPLVRRLRGAALLWAGYGPWLNQHPAVVREFIKANAEATAWAQDPKNLDALYKIVAPQIPLNTFGINNPDVLKSMIKNYVTEMASTQSDSALKAWNTYALRNREYTNSQSITDSIWPGARKSLTGS